MKNTRYEVYPNGFDAFPNHYPIQKLQTAINYAFSWSTKLYKAKIVEYFNIGNGIKMGVTIMEGRSDNEIYYTINRL